MDKLPFDPYDFFGYIASGLLVLVGLQLVLGFPVVLGRDFKPVDLALLVLAVYVAGQAVAGLAKAILEDLIVGRLLQKPSINLFRTSRPWVRWVVLPGFYTPFPPEIQASIRAKMAQDHGSFPADGEARFQQVRFSATVLNNERLIKKLDSFRDKYGFNRNVSFTSFLVGAALLVKTHIAWDQDLFRYGWLALIVGLLLFYRYLKFFRQYSYEMFNVYGGMK
jgi:hypothetical protein